MSGPISLSLWQSLLLLGLGGVAVVYVAYFRIWVAFAIASDLLFVLALALGATSIVTDEPFERAAHALIERSPLPEALSAADARVAALAALPSELIDAALERLGLDGLFEETAEEPGDAAAEAAEAAVEAATEADDAGGRKDRPEGGTEGRPDRGRPGLEATPFPAPTRPSSDTPDPAALAAREAALAPLDGPFTRSIRPSVQAILAMVLRGASFVTSGLLVFLSLATRASTTTARRLRQLSVRVEELESRLEPARPEADGSA